LINPYIRIFLFGNAVHEHLMPLLNEQATLRYNSGIACVRDKKDAISDMFVGFTVIQNDSIPYNTQVIALPPDRDFSEMHPTVNDSIFFVEYWTYLNSESIEMARKFRTEYPFSELRIVLFDSTRKTLSTDVSDAKSALNTAIDTYTQDGFPVTTIQQQEISKLFYWRERKYHDILHRDYREKLIKAREQFRNAYDINYEILVQMLKGYGSSTEKQDMLQPGALENFTSYSETQVVEKLKCLPEESAKSFFEGKSQFVTELEDMLITFTNSICLWDNATILANLLDVLSQAYKEGLMQVLPPVTLQTSDEMAYINFIQDINFNATFAQYCPNFFEDTAKKIIKSYVDNLFAKMEELT